MSYLIGTEEFLLICISIGAAQVIGIENEKNEFSQENLKLRKHIILERLEQRRYVNRKNPSMLEIDKVIGFLADACCRPELILSHMVINQNQPPAFINWYATSLAVVEMEKDQNNPRTLVLTPYKNEKSILANLMEKLSGEEQQEKWEITQDSYKRLIDLTKEKDNEVFTQTAKSCFGNDIDLTELSRFLLQETDMETYTAGVMKENQLVNLGFLTVKRTNQNKWFIRNDCLKDNLLHITRNSDDVILNFIQNVFSNIVIEEKGEGDLIE